METEKILRLSLGDVFPENAVRVTIFDEIMLLKLSIDLNFLSVPSITFKSLGFIDTETVDFLFYINDTKMINYS